MESEIKDINKRGEFLEELRKILISLQGADQEVATLEYMWNEPAHKRIVSLFESTKVQLDELSKLMRET